MLSPAKICMNGLCGAATTHQWKKGWPMKAGGFATLCSDCGTVYDSVLYCERFHLNEPGWRECESCKKPIHCGCVVSKYLHEYLDKGGILCIKCIRSKGTQTLKQPPMVHEIPNGFARFSTNWHPSIFSNQTNKDTDFDKGKLIQLTEGLEKHQNPASFPTIAHQSRQDEDSSFHSSSKDIAPIFKNPLSLASFFPNQLPLVPILDNNKPNLGSKLMYEALPKQALGFVSGTSSSSSILPPNGIRELRVYEKIPSFKQEHKPRQLLPKPSKLGSTIRSLGNKGVGSDQRVGRPPGEGRGRNQLLPRYWPKITDQELQQISGDLNSNSTITPLFEKVLSASDAGRIGRLVLPKACAEAYFPPIHQSEGLPIKIQDIKGKEWTFQFRFWPNNNSRMYVLEGVTPCIQNMQLQAGDTVIFSRLDSDDKLVIGCRKAVISEGSVAPNDVNDGAGALYNGNLPTNMELESATNWDSKGPMVQEKKKARNIGSKSKRLHMNSEDAMELKFTWDEAQEFLRPPLSKPTVVVIEDYEFEEYDEPPVFGKKTIFTMNAYRLQEQWVQCDSCSKWRKLPSDVLIPSKWTCSDNVSDPDRCSCSAPEEKGVGSLDHISRHGKVSKKRKVAETRVPEEPQLGPTGLDALATLAVLGENNTEMVESLAGPTTKHPRHRPGCSCIVCIQPPSGKGKHKPDCLCNVCSTVRRRFKTLMLRKKKRMSERAEESGPKLPGPDDGTRGEFDGPVGEEGSGKGQELDLNCDPKEEEMMLAEAAVGGPEWREVLEEVVRNGTSDVEKVVEGECS